MQAKPVATPKKTLALFRVREAETLKTTSAYYIPGCDPTDPPIPA
jgi:hypothetical protein